ncbi:alpha/beta fold hydrolase [Streptosporangium canum]|uniref:alpha/beta fold hydrolase n=1 Tax=Streptosporangium canum TaxID=324952 RepID=UPI0037B034A6
MIRIGDTEFGCDEAGSGPAVVLVHAGCADRRMWDHQFRTLSERYRMIRYDRRGYGESGDATGEFAHRPAGVAGRLRVGRSRGLGGAPALLGELPAHPRRPLRLHPSAISPPTAAG